MNRFMFTILTLLGQNNAGLTRAVLIFNQWKFPLSKKKKQMKHTAHNKSTTQLLKTIEKCTVNVFIRLNTEKK